MLILSGCCFYLYYYFNNVPVEMVFSDVSYDKGVFSVEVKESDSNSYCVVVPSSFKESEISDADWSLFVDNVCKYKVDKSGNYSVFVKNSLGIKKFDIDKNLYFSTSKSELYLALGDKEKLKIDSVNVGKGSYKIESLDEDVVEIKNNVITGVSEGTAKVVVSNDNDRKEISVVVTDLIDPMPKEYNYNRSYLSCNVFSEKEAELLDKILFSRVKEAGEGTRAGVVAAARFLTLEFPYRISYFSENGRIGNYGGGNKVDGEGRFYHKGLYLTESKFDELNPDYIDKGPNPWGCSIYSSPSKGMRSNGLDCSGFTTWVVRNGGFDPEDLAAHGGDDSIYNLNDIGEEVWLTDEVAMSDKIKAGDLLGEVTVSEGHSAIVVGVDKNNYYVAESLWIQPLGVNINTYSKSELADNFETVNLMDDYYEKQGNYTSMW